MKHDTFGNVTFDGAPEVISIFLYTARPFDAETGLQNNLNRWLDASVGRWLSEDPIGLLDGFNPYRYNANRPNSFIDSTGLWRQPNPVAQPNVWFSDLSTDDFETLVSLATNNDARISPTKNKVCIRPWFDAFIFPERSWASEEQVKSQWEKGKPARCGHYDVGNLIDGWPDGGTLTASIGRDTNNYIANATAFYRTQNRTEHDLTEALRTNSSTGLTPLSGLIVIGHSWSNRTSIGGTIRGSDRFNIGTLGYNAAATPWPVWDDVQAGRFSPICWFRTDAAVRFVGCRTSNFARAFAETLLRGDALAHGTDRPTWAPNAESMGWGTDDRPPRQDQAAGQAATVDAYHRMAHWEAWYNDGTNP